MVYTPAVHCTGRCIADLWPPTAVTMNRRPRSDTARECLILISMCSRIMRIKMIITVWAQTYAPGDLLHPGDPVTPSGAALSDRPGGPGTDEGSIHYVTSSAIQVRRFIE